MSAASVLATAGGKPASTVPTMTKWVARRAGAGITITGLLDGEHRRISNVVEIKPSLDGRTIVAVLPDGGGAIRLHVG